MLTRNYYVLAALQCFHGPLPASLSVREPNGSYRKITLSDNYNYWGLLPSSISNSEYSAYKAIGLIFGDNSAEETFDDYTAGVISNLTSTIGTYYEPTYNEDGNTYTVTRRYVLTNNTTKDITIENFAIFNTFNEYNRGVVVYRKKLDTPFTIAVNETVNFDLTVTYEMTADFTPYVPA